MHVQTKISRPATTCNKAIKKEYNSTTLRFVCVFVVVVDVDVTKDAEFW